MDSICNQPCLFLIFHETTDLWVCGLTGENEHKVAHAVYVCACSVSARYFETFFSFFIFFIFFFTNLQSNFRKDSQTLWCTNHCVVLATLFTL